MRALWIVVWASAFAAGPVIAQDQTGGVRDSSVSETGDPIGWVRDSSVSEMGDPTDYTLALVARTGPDDGAVLMITCNPKEHKPRMAISSPHVLEARITRWGYQTTIRTRLDDGKAHYEDWWRGDNGTIVSSVTNDAGKVEHLAEARVYRVELPVYPSRSQVVQFNLDGLAPSLNWLATRCEWDR